MTRETNFVDLYLLLNLEPGCNLDEFKRAYRRRVAVLHPDRRGSSRVDAVAADRLQQLTTLYAAALAFERRHGRLPGASPAARAPVAGTAIKSGPQAKPRPPRTRTARWPLVIVAAVGLGVAWLLWNPSAAPDDSAQDATAVSPAAPEAAMPSDATDARLVGTLRIGMDKDAVRAAQGEPMMVEDDRWEYGPSWIRFENGRVVDWHSSSLRPLGNASNHPSPTDR